MVRRLRFNGKITEPTKFKILISDFTILFPISYYLLSPCNYLGQANVDSTSINYIT